MVRRKPKGKKTNIPKIRTILSRLALQWKVEKMPKLEENSDTPLNVRELLTNEKKRSK